MYGIVKSWEPDRGFGFIQPKGWKSRDLFVHVTALVDGDGFLVTGETVKFEIRLDGKRRRQAASVEVIRRMHEVRREVLAEMPSLEGVEDGLCSGCGCPVLPGAPHCGACGARFPRPDGLHHRDGLHHSSWNADAGQLEYEGSLLEEEGLRVDNLAALSLS